MIVYVDVLMTINFIMNIMILFSVAKASYIHTKWYRLFLSSFLGSIYSVFMFEQKLRFFYSGVAKLIVSILLILIGFKINSKKKFLKLLLYYYVISFAFSGAATFANNFIGEIKMNNGILYFENNVWILIAATILSYFLIISLLKLFKKAYRRETEKKEIVIGIEGKSVTLIGMLDTGNSLLDPITLYPVIVVEYEQIKEILPMEIKEFLKEGNSLNNSMSRRYLNKIRLIPYNCVGTHSILKGFKPDYVKIDINQDEIIKDVIIAVIYKKLSSNNEFSAILNPQY